MALAQVDDWNDAVRLRFDDPDRRNSLALDTVEQLREVLSREGHRTLVLGSTSKLAFSAGADINSPTSPTWPSGWPRNAASTLHGTAALRRNSDRLEARSKTNRGRGVTNRESALKGCD